MAPLASDPPPAKTSRVIAIEATSGTLLAISTITVLVRCYVRIWLKRAFGLDDWMMVAAMISYLAFGGTSIGSALYGCGHKFEELTVHQGVTAMKYWWIAEFFYCWASVFCKISVCIFLLRITIKALHRWILYILMGLTSASGLIFMLTMMLQCEPINYFWKQVARPIDPSITGHCNIDRVVVMTYIYSGFAALCDLSVGIIPIFIVKDLQMKQSTKIAIAGIIGIACVASCGVLARTAFVPTLRDPEFLYATTYVGVWSNIEAGLGITAGSLATLRPLTVGLFSSVRSNPYHSHEMQGNAQGQGQGPPKPHQHPFHRHHRDDSLFNTVNRDTNFDMRDQVNTVTQVIPYGAEGSGDSTPSRDGSQDELTQHYGDDARGMKIVVHQTVEVDKASR